MPVTLAKYISINTKRDHDVFDGGIFPHNIIHPSCHEVHPRHIIKCRAGDDTNDYDATEDEWTDLGYQIEDGSINFNVIKLKDGIRRLINGTL